jgi:hypothetical protein
MNIFQIVGGCILLGGVYSLYRTQMMWGRRRALKRNAIEVKGVIIKHVSLDSEDDIAPGMFEPIVRFTARDGQAHKLGITGTRDDKKFAIGKRVTIYYEKGNPDNATDSLTRMWDIYLALMFSVGFLLAGLVLFHATYVPIENGLPESVLPKKKS